VNPSRSSAKNVPVSDGPDNEGFLSPRPSVTAQLGQAAGTQTQVKLRQAGLTATSERALVRLAPLMAKPLRRRGRTP